MNNESNDLLLSYGDYEVPLESEIAIPQIPYETYLIIATLFRKGSKSKEVVDQE